jgi:hypothetical protein
MKPETELLIPGLFHLAGAVPGSFEWGEHSPHLNQVLRFGKAIPSNPLSLDEMLLQAFNLPVTSGLPYAAGEPAESTQLLITPVTLRADMNNATILPVSDNPSLINRLIKDLNGFFNVDFEIVEWSFPVYRMHLKGIEPANGMPHYLAALGTPVSRYLDAARQKVEWYRLLNEIQMFLYQHPVNQQRIERGQATINSLWCWGADPRPDAPRADLQIYSEDAEFRALGDLLGQGGFTPGQLETETSSDKRLIVDLSVLRWLKGLDERPVEPLVADLETLIESLLKPRDQKLLLRTGGNQEIEYSAANHWRLWRRPRDLNSFAGAGDELAGFTDQPL